MGGVWLINHALSSSEFRPRSRELSPGLDLAHLAVARSWWELVDLCPAGSSSLSLSWGPRFLDKVNWRK